MPGREDEPVAGAEPDDEEELLAMAAEQPDIGYKH